jgi:hypothetical protein
MNDATANKTIQIGYIAYGNTMNKDFWIKQEETKGLIVKDFPNEQYAEIYKEIK